MMRNPFLLVALLIWLSGDAMAQYQRTPAGENIDVRVLARTPDDLKGVPSPNPRNFWNPAISMG
jgi:hypothetical protein